MAKSQTVTTGYLCKKKGTVTKDSGKTVEIAHDGKKWSSVSVGMDIEKMVPQFSFGAGFKNVQTK